MRLQIHRGSHEIGGSCVELANKDYRIVVDMGMPLLEKDGKRFEFKKYRTLDAVELVEAGVLPSLCDAYHEGSSCAEFPLKGLLLSHAHLDHYGLIKFMRKDVPTYLGEATQKLMELNSMMTGEKLTIGDPRHFDHGIPFECGGFSITPFLMDHSAFDAYAFLIEAEGKRVLYSGDFRAHGRKSGRIPELFEKVAPGIDALLLEGTMVGANREKTLTEEELEYDAARIMGKSPKAVCAYFSAQNIDRLVSFYKAALRSGRMFVMDIYIATLLTALAETKSRPLLPAPGFDKVRVIFPSNVCDRFRVSGLLDNAISKYGRYKIDYEGIAADLSHVVMAVRPSLVDYLGRIPGLDGSTLIYSTWRGYENDTYTKKLLNFAIDKDMDIEYLHTSGHASTDTLKEVIARLEPKRVIPIHTLHPELYSELGGNIVPLAENEDLEL